MKKLLATTLVFALLLLLFAGCQSALAAQQQSAEDPTISRDDALNIALEDAGLTAQDIYDTDIELDNDLGVWHYDVDFEKDGRDYEYEIHSGTGEILHKEVPAEPVAAPDPQIAPDPQVKPETPVTDEATSEEAVQRLTRDEATEIALTHAGLTADRVWDLEAELDRERGVWLYEVDFEADGYEYEYEIHAETGEILRFEKEID